MLRIASVLGRWRGRLTGPQLRTYDEACDELGGVPWRRADATDKWFIAEPNGELALSPLGAPASAPTASFLDSGSFKIARPLLSPTSWAVGAGIALTVSIIVIAQAVAAAPATPVAVRPPDPQQTAFDRRTRSHLSEDDNGLQTAHPLRAARSIDAKKSPNRRTRASR